jgi:hypothetical protein
MQNLPVTSVCLHCRPCRVTLQCSKHQTTAETELLHAFTVKYRKQ